MSVVTHSFLGWGYLRPCMGRLWKAKRADMSICGSCAGTEGWEPGKPRLWHGGISPAFPEDWTMAMYIAGRKP